MTRCGTRFSGLLPWLAMAVLAGSCAGSDPQEQPARLDSVRPDERLAAYGALLAQRDGVLRQTLPTLNATTTRDKSFNSPAHLAAQLLGQWRLEEAIPALAENIDYALDAATMPAGKKATVWALYPAAAALRQIGGQTVRAAMLNGIQETPDPARLLLFAWVLREIEGPEAARIHLQVAIAAATAPEVQDRLRQGLAHVEADAQPSPTGDRRGPDSR